MSRLAPNAFFLPAFLALFLALGAAQAAHLVKDGRPRAEIVVADQPARMARLAAQELRDYVEKISGARLPILAEPSGGAIPIYVGLSEHTERLGLSADGLADGAFRIASGEDWLALFGADEDFDPDGLEPWGRSRSGSERDRIDREWAEIAGEPFRNPFHSLYMHHFEGLGVWVFDEEGTLNAVYEFLRQLGVRWYFPGELGEVVPKMADIPLPSENRVVRADFPVRDWYMYYMHTGLGEDLERWHLRLGYNRGERWIGHVQRCHGMKYVSGTEAFREKHPEFFAIRGGERSAMRDAAGCLSSDLAFDLHVKYVRAMFDHYGERMVNIDLPDGFGGRVCQCDECRSQFTPKRGFEGSYSDYVWGYLNRVAEAVHESHPDRMVSGLAYSGYLLPPENIERMSPNLAIIHCMWRSHTQNPQTRVRHRRTREMWMEKLPSGEWYTYDYFLHGRSGGAWSGVPAYFPRVIAEDLRELRGRSQGDTIEVFNQLHPEDEPYHAFAVSHLNLYVTSRFWWDADTDIDALLEEYYALFYGPAREEMKAFIEYCEAHWPQMRQRVEPIDRAGELLDAAKQAVDPDSVYAKRVRLADDYFRQIEALREQLGRGREGPEIRIPRRSVDDIAMDGRLDDPFWEGVPERPLREVETGDAPEVGTTFRAAWGDNDALYIGIRCDEPDMDGLRWSGDADNDTQIWQGENVELYLETPFHSHYQIAINPQGHVLDVDRSRGIHTLWNSGATVEVHRGEDFWSVEIQLPAAGESAKEIDPDSGVAGAEPDADTPWHLNLGRVRMRDGERELSAFSPTGRQHFGDKFKFGTMIVE